METEAQRRVLENSEEVEEEKETTLLPVRKSRTERSDSRGTHTSTIIRGMNYKLPRIKGLEIQSTLAVDGAHKEESTLANDEKIEKPDGVLENEPDNLVFFDNVEGVGNGKMEILPQSCKAYEEIESADIELINEETEYDVETVLQKQNTHDLYCPNCNSCITRRVILSKRKRTKTQISYEEGKLNKTAHPPVQASDDQVHPPRLIGAEDVDIDSGPDLFRCLSCFSFFVPAGNGLKLFWTFGDKSRKENVRDEQVPPRRRKNWFTSIFAPHNQDTVIEQDFPRASEPLLGTVENDDTLECEDEILLSPRHEHSTNGRIPIYDSGNEPQTITEKIDAKMEQHEVVAGYPLKEPIIINDQFEVVSGYEPIRGDEEIKIIAGNPLKKPVISTEEGQILIQTTQKGSTEKDIVITIDSHPASEIIQGVVIPAETAIPTQTTSRTGIPAQERTEDLRRNYKIEVIKSIVYGGLAETITSLSVLSSAAGGDAATLNILALGMANLIGGFFVICHNLWELRCEKTDQVNDQKDRYQELLGQRQNFKLHAIVCVLSYLAFGLMPIVVYGFSFRQSEERELKLLVVGAVSLLCIIALSTGKAYVCSPPKAYVKTVVNFVILGFMASGISYAAGELVKRFLERLGLFQSTSVSGMMFNGVTSEDSWASY